MPDIHIDALKGPTLAEVPMQPGAQYYLQAGQTHDLGVYKFFPEGCTIDRFGEGDNPVIRKTAAGDAWIYVRGSNVSIRNITIDGNGMSGPLIAVVSAKPDTPVSNVAIANIVVHGSTDHHGIYLRGENGGVVQDVLIEDCQSLLNGMHGMFASGNVRRLVYRRCSVRGNGHRKSAHGFSSWGDSPANAPSYITYDNCIAESTVDASPRQIEGQGFQADDYSQFVTMTTCVARGNAGRGFYFNKSTSGVVRDCRSYQDRRGPIGVSAASFTVDGSFVAYR